MARFVSVCCRLFARLNNNNKITNTGKRRMTALGIRERNAWMANFVNEYYLALEDPIIIYEGEQHHVTEIPEIFEGIPFNDVYSYSFKIMAVMGNKVTLDLNIRDSTTCEGEKVPYRTYRMSGRIKWMKHAEKDHPIFTILERALGTDHLETVSPIDIEVFMGINDGEFVFRVESDVEIINE